MSGLAGCGLAQNWSWPKEKHGGNYLHEARSAQLRLASGQSATTLGGADEVGGDAQGALVRRPQNSYRTRRRLTGTDAVAIFKDAVQYRCDARRDRDLCVNFRARASENMLRAVTGPRKSVPSVT